MERTLRVLLVEDAPFLRYAFSRLLRMQGYVVKEANDGQEALDYLFCQGKHANRSFDSAPRVVLLDLKLPGIDGLDVLRAMKSDPRTRTIPVVILTSSKEQRELVESYNLGVNAYIQKPVDFDEFRKTIGALGSYWIVRNQAPPRSK